MGNLLDDLLRGSGVTVAWDRADDVFPTRAILRFDESFSVEDTGDEIKVGIRFVSGMDGDVIGDTDENIVVAISGDEEEANVVMRAQSLSWDEAELVITGEDAIAIRHNDQEVFAGVASAPRLGTATSVSQLRGGQRFATRVVNSSAVTLDSATTDMLVHVLASTERSITLPPATDGRTIIFLVSGASTVTIKRAGSDLINGSASNYIVPFADACVVLSSVGGDWKARSFADAAGLGGGDAEVPITRRIDTSSPLTGGGDFSADRTIGINPAAYVPPTRSIATTAPLTGGGPLDVDRTLALDPAGFVAPTRTITATAPLTGGGDLSANRSIGIDPTAFVAPTRTVSTTGPLTGGGALSSDLTLGINTSGFVGVGRLVNTTAPLNGGGALSSDLTLGVNAATGGTLGVVQLAGNLGGTAATPLVTGLRADSISVQNTDGSAKGVWATAGLRIGDNTAPAQKLEVVGTAIATGDFLANSGANGKARLAGIVGSLTTHGGIYCGNVTPNATNYTLAGNGTNQTQLNIGAGGTIQLITNGTPKLSLADSAGQVNSIGGSAQVTQFVGGQMWSIKNPALTFDYTIAAGDVIIPVDTTAAIRVITLPSPQSGRSVIIKRRAGTNRVEIANSGTLDGVATSGIFLLHTTTIPGLQPYIWLVGDSGNSGWLIVSYYSIQINLP